LNVLVLKGCKLYSLEKELTTFYYWVFGMAYLLSFKFMGCSFFFIVRVFNKFTNFLMILENIILQIIHNLQYKWTCMCAEVTMLFAWFPLN